MRLSPAPPAFRAGLAALAQLVEHIIRNDGVVSSSLTSGTILPPFIVYFQIHMTETGADTHPSIHLVFSIENPPQRTGTGSFLRLKEMSGSGARSRMQPRLVLLQNADDLFVGKSRSLHCLSPHPDNRPTSKRGHFRGAGHPKRKKPPAARSAVSQYYRPSFPPT